MIKITDRFDIHRNNQMGFWELHDNLSDPVEIMPILDIPSVCKEIVERWSAGARDIKELLESYETIKKGLEKYIDDQPLTEDDFH